ncbi:MULTISPECIES: VOC family protein [Streptomyces]|uniref:VOC family protein n=1 Tax=Streptomyces dengpaensis TaxID=2049881 RepID=A0ABN5I4W6_9ACTN|nr:MULTISPECIES: VOC family protein [Streptomyces]AVH58038.1 VOC family protein [Streptomyces dengpaensis]PIB06470.1 hydroxylase [Streptomyces sp. HG99]
MLTTDYVTGSPNWLDLGSPDTQAAAAFYEGVFGWDLETAGPDAGGYGFFQKGGRTVGGLGPLNEQGASSTWTVYFQSPDVDSTAKAVEQGGGVVRVEPGDVMEAGRMAAFTDPGGADFAVWQPAAVGGLEAASEDDTLCWVELHAPNPSGTLAFYRSLFGWRSQEMTMPGMTYTVLSTSEGDQEDASFGGLAELQEGMEPRWVPYFAVADTDATVAAAQGGGGSVLMPPTDVPDVGRIAWIADPFGALFALLKPNPPTPPTA